MRGCGRVFRNSGVKETNMRLFLAIAIFGAAGAAAVFLVLANPAVTEAQHSELQIVSHQVQTHFPTDVKFLR